MKVVWPLRSGRAGAVHFRTTRRGVANRKRAQQDSVDEAEDGGVGADAEGESENGDGGEAWRLAEHPQPESEVLKKGLHVASRLSAKLQSRPIVPQEWYFVPTHPTVPGEWSASRKLLGLSEGSPQTGEPNPQKSVRS